MSALGLPAIIQGGMGAAVSSWGLAKEVAKCGQKNGFYLKEEMVNHTDQ